MLKQVALLKRRNGMSMEEFVDYYENHHSKLGERYLRKARRYVRRYVRPELNPMTGEVRELDFDVVMEIWWDNREDMEAMILEVSDENIFKEIFDDEEKLFSSHSHLVFTVEEYDTQLPNGISANRA